MSNIDELRKKIKNYNIIILTFVLLLVIAFYFMVSTLFNSKVHFISFIIFIILIFILKYILKQKKYIKTTIYKITIVKSAIEDSEEYKIKHNKVNDNINDNNYDKKALMTDCELYFYDILQKHFASDYLIMPQVNLATIINKQKKFDNQYQNELFRNIDFGIFDKYNMEILLLIEINDKTHNNLDRIERDNKVKNICSKADINLITFHTNYDNKEDYVVNRINKELEKNIKNENPMM